MPIFGNPLGLWALAGLPVILAIHFLQQRARIARTSTWFLIERLAPDSTHGRAWDRIRSSRQLWLQLLAVLVATWVVAEPRWVRTDSAQTVVLVLDASASMDAFREPALAAAEFEMSLAEGLAARTTWVILTTNAAQPPLYRGEERAAASRALTRWQPDLGTHDLGPALRLARGLAGTSGRTLLITDQRGKVPPDQRAAGVGSPIENVGFVGATMARGDAGLVWRTIVANHASRAQTRTWHVESGTTRSAERSIDLAPGALMEISAAFPEDGDEAVVVLSADGFTADDRLPLVRPKPKPLVVSVEGTDDAVEFFRKLAASVDGVTVTAVDQPATLRLGRRSADALEREAHGGVFWPPVPATVLDSLAPETVTPERNDLVAGLNWQGWFGTGPLGYSPKPGDVPLLWQGKAPLVLIRPGSGEQLKTGQPERKLLLAFDWATSNASRLPATVLLVRRFLAAERDAQHAPYRANFDTNGSIPLSLPRTPRSGLSTEEGLTMQIRLASGGPVETRIIPPTDASDVHAPGRSGFFRLQRGEELLVHGAVQFADARQGDFRAAERFLLEVRGERQVSLERNTRSDPFVACWLVALAGLLLASWWSKSRGASPDSLAERPRNDRRSNSTTRDGRSSAAGVVSR